jgi:hypothetical protein
MICCGCEDLDGSSDKRSVPSAGPDLAPYLLLRIRGARELPATTSMERRIRSRAPRLGRKVNGLERLPSAISRLG